MTNDMISNGANNKPIKRKRLSSTGQLPPNTLRTLTTPETQTIASDDEQGPE